MPARAFAVGHAVGAGANALATHDSCGLAAISRVANQANREVVKPTGLFRVVEHVPPSFVEFGPWDAARAARPAYFAKVAGERTTPKRLRT